MINKPSDIDKLYKSVLADKTASDINNSYAVTFSGDENEFTFYIVANNKKDLLEQVENKLKEIFETDISIIKTASSKQKYYNDDDQNWFGWLYIKKGVSENKYNNSGRTITYKVLKKFDKNNNFWKWFGSSKIVDDNGNPLVVYHGSSSRFESFNNSNKIIFFTDDNKLAKRYGKDCYSCYLRIENPKIIDMDGYNWWGEDVTMSHDKFSINKGRKTNYVYLESINAKRHGYDGVIFYNIYDGPNWSTIYNPNRNIEDFKKENSTNTDYVVFEPNQIKSINNNGDWSLYTSNIYK